MPVATVNLHENLNFYQEFEADTSTFNDVVLTSVVFTCVTHNLFRFEIGLMKKLNPLAMLCVFRSGKEIFGSIEDYSHTENETLL